MISKKSSQPEPYCDKSAFTSQKCGIFFKKKINPRPTPFCFDEKSHKNTGHFWLRAVRKIENYEL